MVLVDDKSCKCLLDPASPDAPPRRGGEVLTFDSTASPRTLNPKQIMSGCGAGAMEIVQEGQKLNSNMKVKSVELANLRPVPGGDPKDWQGDWEINFENASMELRPLSITQRFTITNPNTAASTISECKGLSATAEAKGIQYITVEDGGDGSKDFLMDGTSDNRFTRTATGDLLYKKSERRTWNCKPPEVIASGVAGMLNIKGDVRWRGDRDPDFLYYLNTKGEIERQ